MAKFQKDAMPFGFRGINHLVTSGSNPLTGPVLANVN